MNLENKFFISIVLAIEFVVINTDESVQEVSQKSPVLPPVAEDNDQGVEYWSNMLLPDGIYVLVNVTVRI